MVFGPFLSPASSMCLLRLHRSRISLSFLSISAIVAHITYIVPFITAFTGQNGALQRARAFGRNSVLKRLEVGANRKDLFYYLVRQRIESGMLTLKPIAEWRGASRGGASLCR